MAKSHFYTAVRYLIPFTVFIFTGCIERNPDLTKLIELTTASAGRFAFQLILWTILGMAGGFIAAIGVFFSALKIIEYIQGRSFGNIFQIFVFCIMTVLFVLCTGTTGFLEGILRGAKSVLIRSDLADRVYPPVGNAGADLMAAIYLGASRFDSGKAVNEEGKDIFDDIEAFRQNRWELNVPTFFRRLNRMEAKTLNSLADALQKNAQSVSPDLRDGMGKKVLSGFLHVFCKMLLPEVVSVEVDDLAAPVTLSFFSGQLTRAAKQKGAPDTITHPELSVLLVETIIVTPCIGAAGPLVRGYQVIALSIMVGGLMIILLLMMGAGMFGQKKKSRLDDDYGEYEDYF